MNRSLVGQGTGQRILPSPYSAARASHSAMRSLRASPSPHEERPLALKIAPANTPRQLASGSRASIRSAASHE